MDAAPAGLEIRAVTFLDGDPGTVRHVYVLRGDEGAVHFIYADWHPNCPPETRAIDTKFMIEFGHPLMPMGYDVGYHSPAPMSKFQVQTGPGQDDCMWLDGRPCWGDGSALRGQNILAQWLAHGRDLGWLTTYLAGYYEAVFRSDSEHAPIELMEMVSGLLLGGDEVDADDGD